MVNVLLEIETLILTSSISFSFLTCFVATLCLDFICRFMICCHGSFTLSGFICSFSVSTQQFVLYMFQKALGLLKLSKKQEHQTVFSLGCKEGRCRWESHFLLSSFSADLLSSLSLSVFFNLLSDCKDRLYQQLEKNRLLTNELRVALNED